jgi:long-chain fatty acid transport protein
LISGVFGTFDFNQEGKMQKNCGRILIALAVASTLGGASTLATAAGFALIEQSASGMGNAFAGAAATAEDASTIFFNPAGLTKLEGKQAAFAAHIVDIKTEFSNSGASTSPATITTLGGNGGNAGDTVVIPNAYLSMPLGDSLVLGLGVNSPFGLATEYDSTWVGRFQGIKSELMTYNINPTVAYKINDAISVGAGFSYQHLDAELTNKVNGAAINGAFAGQEFNAKLEADDEGWGWNAGILIDAGASTRIGFSYRSTIEYKLEGSVTVTNPAGTTFAPASGAATADLTVPDTFSLSLLQKLGDRLDLLADVTLTRWSEIQQIRITNPANGAARDTLILNFDDTYRYSLGMNYRFSDRFTGKFGVALDQSPVSDRDRTVRLPDNDRKWVAVGGSLKVGNSSKVDFGYAHLFVSDTPIDQNRGSSAGFGRVVGSYDASIDILSAQYSVSF